MPVSRRDHKVDFRSRTTIGREAMLLRAYAGLERLPYFNIVDFIEHALRDWLRAHGKGELRIELFDASPEEDLASVTFKPMTLRVDRDLWRDASIGESVARFYLAHEIGHLVLHDHYAQAFSNDPALQIKFAQDEFSAEWQANEFAYDFLVPDAVAAEIGDARSIARQCAVTLTLAEGRLAATTKASRPDLSAAFCSCGSLIVVRNGIPLTCTTCTQPAHI